MTESGFVTYTASLSRSQGRGGWSVIFRHPILADYRGQYGRRVRRGLGTRDEGEAIRLVNELNEILRTPDLWSASARPNAETRFDRRIVAAFYDRLETDDFNSYARRDDAIPFPEDHHRILLLGTTGAGKTTLVRRFLGTDPRLERFPSISTGKTTVADMEFILADGDFSAVVTFMPLDLVIHLIEDCVSSATMAAIRKESDDRILNRLLQHVEQRFRLNYILTNGPDLGTDEIEDPEDQEESFTEESTGDEDLAIDLEETKIFLRGCVDRAKKLAESIPQTKQDSDAIVGEFVTEEEVDTRIRSSQDFDSLVFDIKEEIKKRFSLLKCGHLSKSKQGWPEIWEYSTHFSDRKGFIRVISRFTSNQSAHFGTLLTPLVDGIRVQGPFRPDWVDDFADLVLIDGEGLGHSPETASSLPTSILRLAEEVDTILLVDNAQQPMQAAPTQALVQLAAAGLERKLRICFTHFDQVTGVNFRNEKDKREHVYASVENVLRSIGQNQGLGLEQSLREHLKDKCFYVGGIQDPSDLSQRQKKKLYKELDKLLDNSLTARRPLPDLEAGPVPLYSTTKLLLHIQSAVSRYHDWWEGILGVRRHPIRQKEHWARIKALTRRLGLFNNVDEYGDLRPVGDLCSELQQSLSSFIEHPERWDGDLTMSDDVCREILNRFKEKVSSGIRELASERIHIDRKQKWVKGYSCRGSGSSFDRAEIISKEVLREGAPVPTDNPNDYRLEFVARIQKILYSAAAEVKARFV